MPRHRPVPLDPGPQSGLGPARRRRPLPAPGERSAARMSRGMSRSPLARRKYYRGHRRDHPPRGTDTSSTWPARCVTAQNVHRSPRRERQPRLRGPRAPLLRPPPRTATPVWERLVEGPSSGSTSSSCTAATTTTTGRSVQRRQGPSRGFSLGLSKKDETSRLIERIGSTGSTRRARPASFDDSVERPGR